MRKETGGGGRRGRKLSIALLLLLLLLRNNAAPVYLPAWAFDATQEVASFGGGGGVGGEPQPVVCLCFGGMVGQGSFEGRIRSDEGKEGAKKNEMRGVNFLFYSASHI